MLANLSNPAVPKPLKVVAYLFIVGGILLMTDTVVGFFTGRWTFNVGGLYIIVGWGLLRLDARWLAWAQFFTWLGLLFMPIVAACALFTPDRLQHFDLFGVPVGQGTRGLSVSLCLVLFAAFYWQQRVLQSLPVRRLFTAQTRTRRTV